ncbi:hypothetical protein FD723_25765 [Nostoc sp. C052]|uniref:hypothetical protein n=1 Tax=unclassified Nostoc TaxID=2593658 RepID=UPI0015C2C2BE|nr:hypothetical protein [Nostoc sp. C052]QLE43514.1 hypothetical protein FD723_25765 [Nostoc sp. C052]
MVQAAVSTELTLEAVINLFLEKSGEPTDEWQHQALEQYKKGDALAVKKISVTNIFDFQSVKVTNY